MRVKLTLNEAKVMSISSISFILLAMFDISLFIWNLLHCPYSAFIYWCWQYRWIKTMFDTYVTCCMILKSRHSWKKQHKVLPVSELLEGRWGEGGTAHTRWILWRCSSCKDAARPPRILYTKSKAGKPSQESKFQSFKLLWTHTK